MKGAHDSSANPVTGKQLLPSTELISDGGTKLLDAIDGLRSLGIDKDIPLPQIVVVGLQSAGKSSVLEAISGISFPVNDGQCTTFASEIRLRRSKSGKEEIAMNIVSKTTGSAGEERLRPLDSPGSARDGNTWNLMSDIIEDAADKMGDHKERDICDDVLRIEVCGPNQDHLSLIDLPGIFHAHKAGQDPTGPERVKSTVLRYMREKRSIILAVVSARLDFSSQEILKLVDTIDPHGSRTMGVITGVDEIPTGSPREHDYIQLAKNELKPFALGWHVVRNLRYNERQDAEIDRDTTESAFFAREPAWQAVQPRDRGALQLKRKLSDTLLAHIGKELGGVIGALEQKIEQNERILQQLGPERSNVFEQRAYLTKIGTDLRDICKEAVAGTYDNVFFSLTEQRLRATLEREYDYFDDSIIARGHTWDFWTDPNRSGPLFGSGMGIGKHQSALSDDKPVRISREDYLMKVDCHLRENRGRELRGNFDPRMLGTLFKDQSGRWGKIAKDAIRKIVALLRTFLTSATEHVVEPKRAQLLLHQKCLPHIRRREELVLKKLEEILSPFQTCPPLTRNPRLHDLNQQYREARALSEEAEGANMWNIGLRDRAACEKLTVAMQSYYEISRATFIDNVITLGVEVCLLDGFSDILAPSTVMTMSDEEVSELASEFVEDTIQRRKARMALTTLRSGLEICRQHDQRGFEAFEIQELSRPLFAFAQEAPADEESIAQSASISQQATPRSSRAGRSPSANSDTYAGHSSSSKNNSKPAPPAVDFVSAPKTQGKLFEFGTPSTTHKSLFPTNPPSSVSRTATPPRQKGMDY
jgi:GTPase SAR1 family protein